MKNIIILVIVAALGAGVYFFFVDPDKGQDLVNKHVKGFKSAKDPQEALDQFQKAIEERNYTAAATYVTAEYEPQLKKADKEAKEVGEAIDNLREQMKAKSVISDVGLAALLWLDPFPIQVKFKDMKKVDDNKATAVMYFDIDKEVLAKIGTFQWNVDNRMRNVLYQRAPTRATGWWDPLPVTLTKSGEGDNVAWKINFPKTPEASLDFFIKRAGNVKNGLKRVKDSLNDPTNRDREGFEKRLKAQLESDLKE